jgi:hypothetical protein
VVIKSLYSRVCFLTYIPYGKPCFQPDCSRLLLCVCVYMSLFLGLPSASVAVCAALLFLCEWHASCSSSIKESISEIAGNFTTSNVDCLILFR